MGTIFEKYVHERLKMGVSDWQCREPGDAVGAPGIPLHIPAAVDTFAYTEGDLGSVGKLRIGQGWYLRPLSKIQGAIDSIVLYRSVGERLELGFAQITTASSHTINGKCLAEIISVLGLSKFLPFSPSIFLFLKIDL